MTVTRILGAIVLLCGVAALVVDKNNMVIACVGIILAGTNQIIRG